MTGFLVRHLVKNWEKTEDPAVRERYGVMSGAVGILLNLLLCAGKFTAGILTGAISITADAFNNLSDAASSVVTLVGFRMAGQKADRGHPFGHGRIEYLAGLAVSVLILVVGVELGKSSIEKIIHPEAVEFTWLSAGILLASVLIKLWMSRFNRVLSKRIDSAAMAATATDSLSDAVATSAVLAGLLISGFAHVQVDGWIGLLVAVFILRAGIGAAKDTLNPLLGQPPAPELVNNIEHTILSHPQIVGVHDLVIHDYGPGRCMMSVHAEVPAESDMMEVHDVIDHVERELKERYRLEAVIHMDPIDSSDPKTTALRDKVAALAREIDPAITIHDFRVTPGPLLTNLIFDAVVPYEVKLTDEEVKQALEQKVKTLDEHYYTVVEIDRCYVR